MGENTQRPQPEVDNESEYWNGYWRGLIEAGEIWVTICTEIMGERYPGTLNLVLDQVTRELGGFGVPRTTTSRPVGPGS